MPAAVPPLEIKNLTFTYAGAGTAVFTDLSFTLQPGEYAVLTGNTGAGKTTLCRMVNGVIPQVLAGTVSGLIRTLGVDPAEFRVQDIARQVGAIHDNPDIQIVGRTVYEDVCFGPRNYGLPVREICSRADEILRLFQLDDFSQRAPHTLSGGEKQRLNLAGVLIMQPGLLVLDEAFSEMDANWRARSREILARYQRENNMTILSTEASESGRFRSADQVIELDSRTHSCAIGAGAAVQEPPAPTKVRKEEPLLILDGLSCEYDGRTILDSLQGVLHRGEAAVLTGDNGSGKTTLLRHLAGLQAVLPGCARFLGRDLTEETPETLFPAIGTVFQNPDAQLFHLTVTAEIAYGPKNAARSGRDSEHVINTEALIETLGLGAITDRHPHTLPRGKRQLVACAAAMAAAPQLLLMDEPLRCLDPEDADRLLALLHTMKHSGTAMIIVDHASPRLRSLADSRWRLENGALSITPFAGGSGADI